MDDAEKLIKELLDSKNVLNIDGLLDAVIALLNDCNYPVVKRVPAIESFLSKHESIITQFQNYRMKYQDFHLIRVIGKGAFGEVQLVRHKTNKQVYAMKLLDKIEMIRRSESAFFWDERHIMAHANSDWIVQLHYSFQDTHYLYMVMEFMPGGDLVNLMLNSELTEKSAQFYVAELVLALEAIHSFGYIHRDVKPDNLLISKSGHIKLADFGTCLKMNKDGLVKSSTAVGTPDYISPEVLMSQGSEKCYGREVDWWSVGILLYEMLYCEAPFYADSLATTYAKIMSDNREIKFPDDVEVSDNAKDLINQFLSDSDVRLGRDGSESVKAHPFFKNSEWTFETIRNAVPPVVPELKSDDDTTNFDIVESSGTPENIQIPKAFQGNHLPFIGFTYSNDFGPLEKLRKLILPNQNKLENIKLNKPNNIDPLIQSTISEDLKENVSPLPTNENNNCLSDKLINELQTKYDHLDKEKATIFTELCMLRQRMGREMACETFCINELQEQIETEQHLGTVFKLELKAKNEELNERDRRFQQYERELEELREKYCKERMTRQFLEENLEKLKRDKVLLDNELRQTLKKREKERCINSLTKNEELNEMEKRSQNYLNIERELEDMKELYNKECISRQLIEEDREKLRKEKQLLDNELLQTIQKHEKELVTTNSLLNASSQRESELNNTVKNLQREVSQFRKHSIGTISNPSISNAPSASSLNTTTIAPDLLESLTKEQLIIRCNREISMKEIAIQKLMQLGQLKGINAEKNDSRKKKNESKRIQGLVDFQMNQERKKHRQIIEKMDTTMNELQNQIYEEQRNRLELEKEVAQLRAFAQQVKEQHFPASDVDSASNLFHKFDFAVLMNLMQKKQKKRPLKFK